MNVLVAYGSPVEVRGLMVAIGAEGQRVFAGSLDRSTIDGADFPFIERVVAKRFVPEGDFRKWDEIEAWPDEIAHELMRTNPSKPSPVNPGVAG